MKNNANEIFLAHISAVQFNSLTDFSDKRKCCEKSVGLLITNSLPFKIW